MRYVEITKSSFVNGEGCRTVLWVTGCNHHCDGCQNHDLQDPKYGKVMTTNTLSDLLKCLQKPHIDGLTLSGGDPMFPPNRDGIRLICQYLKAETGKSIWMYTGYLFQDIINDPVLEYVDVIVDGKYDKNKNLTPALYRGSSNQRIWRKEKGVWRYEK